MKPGEMCDSCGEIDPRVPVERGYLNGVIAWICALCKAEYMRWNEHGR